MRAAVENARKKAELIAEASGAAITGVIKIQSGRGFDEGFFDKEMDTIIVTGTRIRAPRATLDIEPQPVAIRAEVAAAFEIE